MDSMYLTTTVTGWCHWDHSGAIGEESEMVLGIFLTEDEAKRALAGKKNQRSESQGYDYSKQPCGRSSWVEFHLRIVKVGTPLWKKAEGAELSLFPL